MIIFFNIFYINQVNHQDKLGKKGKKIIQLQNWLNHRKMVKTKSEIKEISTKAIEG